MGWRPRVAGLLRAAIMPPEYRWAACPPRERFDLDDWEACGGCDECPGKAGHRCHRTGELLACVRGRPEDPLQRDQAWGDQ